MHLLDALISGFQNAGNGTAAVTRRGTTTPATLYSSFEGMPFASSDLDSRGYVILDSYGRKEVYVNEVVDVAVYDQDAVLLVLFTAGSAASAIEVRSPSFTGNDYSTGEADEGLPTTLQAVLDKWFTAQKASDWVVTGAAQPFIVVTDDAYGAKGDGVADDTLAIKAALAAATAAGGGNLFFPPGMYRTTATLAITDATVTFVGSGKGISSIAMDAPNTSLLQITNGCLRASAMSLRSLQPNTANLIVLVSDSPSAGGALVLDQCIVGGSTSQGHLLYTAGTASADVQNSTFYVSGLAKSAIFGVRGSFRDSDFYSPTGIYSGSGLVYSNYVNLQSCAFNLNVSGGTIACFAYNGADAYLVARVMGCLFSAAAAGVIAYAMDLGTFSAGTQFLESGNTFPIAPLNLTAYRYNAAATPTHTGVMLATREMRQLIISNNATPLDIPAEQYGTIIVKSTSTAIVLNAVGIPPSGASGRVIVYHPSGGAGTAGLAAPYWFGQSAATTANTSTHVWEYISCTVNATLRMMVTIDARALGTGA